MRIKRIPKSEKMLTKVENSLTEPEKMLTDLSKQIFELLTVVYGQSPWSEAYILADLRQQHSDYFVLEEGDKLLGFLAISMLMDELEVTNLAVHPDVQGQGFATNLLTELENFTGSLFLEVRASNLPAQKCYEKFGFVIYHRRKNYYEKPVEDALLMRKEQF